MLKLAPSILSADFKNLGKGITDIEEAGAHYVHIDVMDGMFVPNISFGLPVIQAVRPISGLVFDVHLMIEEPGRYIEAFKEAGADLLCVHAEACKHLHSTVMQIKEAGMKAAVALNPATPLHVLDYVLEELSMVLIMTVNPGFGGQSFIPGSIDKIQALRAMAEKRNLHDLDIEVDGGINQQNVRNVIQAGANVIVAGSAVYKGDVKANVESFLQEFEKCGSCS